MQNYYGELAALLVAIFWTITSLAFEDAGKRVGSLSVNFVRLVIGFILLTLFTWAYRGKILPTDASIDAWLWLSLSGLVGFVLGDLFLFKAFTIIGARFSMLLMTLVPPVTAFAGWIILGEKLQYIHLLGMSITLLGIFIANMARKRNSEKQNISHPVMGIIYALGGVLGQAIGLVLSKKGMAGYDAFASTQIRIITGIIGFGIIVLIFKRTQQVALALKNAKAMIGISTGALFGPFLGVSFSLVAVKYTQTGIASTLMQLVPLFIIVPSVLIFKQKITKGEIIGAFIGVAGVILFFI